jgi:radical SAM superfamily enzyme YgiQ (UPF0313 family)
MFKDKQFRIRDITDVLEDLEDARRTYRTIGRIFLADGDALVLKNETLLIILERIRTLFPECERVSVYGSPQDVLRKTPEELIRLREAGVGMIYIGAESGSDKVLKAIRKGATAAEITEAVRKIETAGIPASVTFINGIAGADGWREHATMTGRMISESQPSYVGLLTLMVERAAPLYDDIESGRFELLSPAGVVDETLLMLENTEVDKDCVFRSNHASNYLSLKGTLPGDKMRLIAQLEAARGREELLKDERLRML